MSGRSEVLKVILDEMGSIAFGTERTAGKGSAEVRAALSREANDASMLEVGAKRSDAITGPARERLVRLLKPRNSEQFHSVTVSDHTELVVGHALTSRFAPKVGDSVFKDLDNSEMFPPREWTNRRIKTGEEISKTNEERESRFNSTRSRSEDFASIKKSMAEDLSRFAPSWSMLTEGSSRKETMDAALSGRTTVGKSAEASEHNSGIGFRSIETPKPQISEGIPAFRDDGFLPAGVHVTKWDAFTEHYGTNKHRTKLIGGLLDAVHDLKEIGVKEAYIGGSFVTRKEIPGDFDLAFPRVSDLTEKMPILWDRDLMKKAYGGEMYADHMHYFQRNTRVTPSVEVGIVKLDLNSIPARVSGVSPAKAIWETEGPAGFQSENGSSFEQKNTSSPNFGEHIRSGLLDDRENWPRNRSLNIALRSPSSFSLIDELSISNHGFDHMNNFEIESGVWQQPRQLKNANHESATDLPAWDHLPARDRIALPADPLTILNAPKTSGSALDAVPARSSLPTEIPNSLYVSHRILESLELNPAAGTTRRSISGFTFSAQHHLDRLQLSAEDLPAGLGPKGSSNPFARDTGRITKFMPQLERRSSQVSRSGLPN